MTVSPFRIHIDQGVLDDLKDGVANSSANQIAGMQPDDFLDLKLDSRVRGKSLRVLPLAIFS